MQVSYVGKKDVQHDIDYGSGFWQRGETRDVEEETALKLALHSDVWTVKKTKGIEAKIEQTRKQMQMRYTEQVGRNALVVPGKDKVLDQAGKDQEAKFEVLPRKGMDRDALQRYAMSSFNKEFPASMSVEEMEKEVHTLIRQRE